MEILKWGQGSGYNLNNILDSKSISDAILNGYLDMIKWLRKVKICCTDATKNGHLKKVEVGKVPSMSLG